MKLSNQKLKYNLQFFADKAEDGDGTDNSGDGDNDQEEEQLDEKKFTQADIDKAIKDRLAREKKKAEKKQTATDDKSEDKPADNKADENATKLSALEMKVLCYDHDIAKEYMKEAIAIAKTYVDDDTDMDEALEKAVKKFPQFGKDLDSKKKKSDDEDEDEDETDNKKGSWGQRQKSQKLKSPTDMSYEEYKEYRQGNKKGR